MGRKELSEGAEAELKLSRAAFDRNGQAFERMMAAYDRFEKRFDEHQVFMRDMHRRSELVTQKIIRDHEEFMQELKLRDSDAEARANAKSAQILAELKEGREESRAQRQAMLALIDRLPPPSPT